MKRFIPAISLSVLFSAFSAPLFSQEACMTFDDALSLSAQRDPNVQAARAQEAQAAAGVKEAKSLNRPQLSAFARTGTGNVGLIDSGIQNQTGFRLSQRVIDFGDAKFARQVAQRNLESSAFSVREAEVAAAQESGFLYLGMLDALQRIDATKERLSYYTRQLESVDNALSTGGATRTDRADVAAQLADTQAFQLELEFQYEQAETRLWINTGTRAEICKDKDLDQYLTSMTDTIRDQQTAVHMALRDNASIRALVKQADSLQAAYEREKRNQLPVIDVVGLTSVVSDGSLNADVNGRIGLDVSVPIASGGELSARRDRAFSREAAARAQVRTAMREVEEQVSISYRRIASLTKQLQTRRFVEEQNWAQFKAAETEYDLGAITLPDLVEIRMEFEDSTIERIRVEYDLLRQRMQLLVLTASLPFESGADV